jgi:hypothetical protein
MSGRIGKRGHRRPKNDGAASTNDDVTILTKSELDLLLAMFAYFNREGWPAEWTSMNLNVDQFEEKIWGLKKLHHPSRVTSKNERRVSKKNLAL